MIAQLGSKIRSLLSNSHNLRAAVFNFGGQVVLTSFVVTGLIVGARQVGLLEGLELGAYDQLMRWRPDEGVDERLLVVGISEADLQAINQYPIFDGTLAALLQKIQEHQPLLIGIDIIRDIPQGTGRKALIEQMAQSENVIAVCKLSSADQPGTPTLAEFPPEGIGFADLPDDRGGTIRRSLLLSPPIAYKHQIPARNQHLCNDPNPENQIPSLSFQLARLYLESLNIVPELTPQGEVKLGSTVFKRLQPKSGGYHNADVKNYQLMLNYRSGKNSVRQVSLTEIMNGTIDPAWVKDHIVLIGYTAPLVKDSFYTPYSAGEEDSQKMPGVVIHAQNVSQILSAVLNKRPLIWFWSEPSEILWIWGWSLVGGIIAWRFRRPLRFGIVGMIALGVLLSSCYFLFLQAGWIPLVPPLLTLVGTAVGVILTDRGYTKSIYKGVRGFLKINIAVNQEKKEETTEIDYLQEVQQKGQLLKHGNGNGLLENGAEPIIQTRRVGRTLQSTESFEGLDYFQQLERRMQLKKAQGNALGSEGPWESDDEDGFMNSHTEDEAAEEDYFQQLQKRARKLKHREGKTEQ